MSKPTKRSRRSRRAVDRSATIDVVTQLEVALRNPHAAAIGALIGGLVPWFGRTLAHGEIQDAWSAGNRPLALVMVAVVIGCGLFSGLSVYKFGRAAFGDPRKALGFVLALEGVMLVSHGATSGLALMVLILINAVANGSVIALARDATRRKQEADARGAATRARSRAAAGGVHGTGKHGAQNAPLIGAQDAPPLTESSAAVSVPPQGSPEASRALVIPVRWRWASLDDVPDAEIVAEALLS
jgi:hypothetical protein